MPSEWEVEISTSSYSRPWDLHIWNLICQRAATNTRASEAEQKGSSKCASCGKWNAHIHMILNWHIKFSAIWVGEVVGHWPFTYLTVHQNIIASSWNVLWQECLVKSSFQPERRENRSVTKHTKCRIQLSVRIVESFRKKKLLSLFKLYDSLTSREEWRRWYWRSRTPLLMKVANSVSASSPKICITKSLFFQSWTKFCSK